MYSPPHYPGDLIDRFTIYGVFEDGTERPINSKDLGLGYWYFTQFTRAITTRELDEVKGFSEHCEKKFNVQLTALRLENHPLVFSGHGVDEGEVEIVETIYLENL